MAVSESCLDNSCIYQVVLLIMKPMFLSAMLITISLRLLNWTSAFMISDIKLSGLVILPFSCVNLVISSMVSMDCILVSKSSCGLFTPKYIG